MENALQFGLSFQDEIRKRLDETDLLVVIYSGALKASHSFTGMELGYFIGTMERNQQPDRQRKIGPIYLDNPPDIQEMKGSTLAFLAPLSSCPWKNILKA